MILAMRIVQRDLTNDGPLQKHYFGGLTEGSGRQAGFSAEGIDLRYFCPGLRHAPPSFMPLPSPHRRLGPTFVSCR
jgi:hypothetical protein